jgi:hypothetical protein
MPDYGEKKYNCLTGCGEKYRVDPIWQRAPMEVQAESFAPVIKVKIGIGGSYITVGNESYPSKENTAVIKSLDMGFFNSNEGSIEIIDEDGGAFSVWINSIQKCMSNDPQRGSNIYIQIGWTFTYCDGGNGMILSPIVQNILAGIETSIGNGVIRFNAKITTVDSIAQNYREDKTYGEQKSGQRMKLEDAIEQLMLECPSMNVEFGYYNQNDELVTGKNKLKWLKNGIVTLGGPEAAWQCDRQNRFNSIAKWMEGFRIKDGEKDRGIVLINDPSRPNTLMILQDPNPENKDPGLTNGRHVGTFIVNGGKCSNVLEFSPKFDMTAVHRKLSSGGNTKGGLSSDNEMKSTNKTASEKKQCDTSGIQQTITLTQQIEDVAGKDAPSEVNKSQDVHIKANTIFDIQGSVLEADLRIVGSTNPFFYTVMALGAPLSIIVISPFTIRGGKTGRDCGDFLKRAECHPVFSNKKWIIKGVNHSIKEGSFVTTLKVILPTTGFELDWGEPFGNDPEGFVLSGC